MSKILVVGANGTVGQELVRILRSEGKTVMEATSKTQLRAGQVHLDLTRPVGIPSALTGIEKVFLLSPPGYTNQHELLGPVIDQARASGVKKIVLMTAMGANAIETSPMRQTEIKLERSGVRYNIIRPNWFMQNFNSYWLPGILAQNQIALPVAKAQGSFIDTRDIAAVAAALLGSDRFDNQDFDLTGSEVLDHDQAAEILSRVSGRKISYQDISAPVMLETLLAAGLPRPYAEFMLVILGFFKEGYSARTTDSVQKIMGRAPIKFEQYAQDYRKAWAPGSAKG